MIYEFCAENVTLLEKAMQAGAPLNELWVYFIPHIKTKEYSS